QGCQLPFQIENLILQVKRDHPSWGAPKIREKIRRKHSDIRLPAISTVHAVLHRHGLVNVNRRRQRSHKAQGTALSRPLHPNELWCADYKGEFMLADRRYCYPLTITDAASRYLLCCEALPSTCASLAFTVFERIFKDFGLPASIRTDNGVPFASPNSDRAHQARSSTAKRPPRANASDPQARGHQARLQKLAQAARALR